ncbi:uncharacterized protein LOC131620369 [Vicia villosa]|uniref:uncharacterized protein LOC131620369 n=1 Tax=Vicia villosa TaxID=3911 RepID=UPI00273CB713|nr:uncharacterized protein LOC131620369 [Vicia villosa]XP_058747406.1 uncharacterized protein LOC131620369 [Vicia villosa]XP_058747407.1 uncharacterized protein LOC131620369 [Vicia villosa]
MSLKVKRTNWVGNIYQKFEAVCHEVDGIVGQDAVKYLENRVYNVGDSMKKLYSEVVELRSFPALSGPAPTKYEAHSVALKNNIGLSFKSVCSVEDKDKNKNGVEENPVNNYIDLANDQLASHPDKHELVNQVNSETHTDSLEVEDSFITRKEVIDDSRETSVVEKEDLHASIEETAIKSASELESLLSVEEKEPLEFSMHSQSYYGSSDSASGISVRIEDTNKVNVKQDPFLIFEENNMSLSAEVLNSTSVGVTELSKASLFNESTNVDKGETDILAEVLPVVSSSSCKRPNITETRTSDFKCSLVSDSPYSESHKCSLGYVASCISDSSVAHVCYVSSQIAGQVKESHDGIISSCRCQPMESNDESRSIESSLEDIQLNNDTKLEESCVFVADSELYAVSYRIQKLRSYKKRIQDAFCSKKRLAKEYEQLAIWYGDAEMEPNQDTPQTHALFSSRTYETSKNLQVQQASETEWELL